MAATTLTVYSFNDMLSMALSNNIGLKIQNEKVIQSNRDVDNAKSGLVPNIKLGGDVRNAWTAATSRATAGLSLSASLPFYDAGKQNSTIMQYAIATQVAEHQTHTTLVDLAYNIKLQAYELKRQEKLLGLNKQVVKRRQQQLDLVRLRYNAGLENSGSLYTTEANLAVSEEERKTLLRKMETQKRNLCVLTGIPANTDFTVTLENEPALPTAPNMKTLIDHHDRVVVATLALDQAKQDLLVRSADQSPQLSLAGSLDGSQSLNTGIIDNSASLGLSATYGLFDGGAKQAQFLKSESIIREREKALEQEKASLQSDVLLAYNDALDAQSNQMTTKKFREAAQERSIIGNKRYSTGFINFDSWLLIENDLLQAEKNEINAQINYAQALAKWQQIQGGINP